MTFQEFCDRYANPELIEITCTDEVPREFVEPINTLVGESRSSQGAKSRYYQNLIHSE